MVKSCYFWFLLLLFGGAAQPAMAQDLQSAKQLHTFLEKHCYDCHTGDEASGGLDFQKLGSELSNLETTRRWVRIHDRIQNGEMPPKSVARPEKTETAANLNLLAKLLSTAEQSRAEVVLRRLNRREYENTVRDLFETSVRVKDLLPEDTPTAGFDTVGEGLAVSAEAMQAYLQAADVTLDAVFGPEKEPKRIQHTTNLLDQKNWDGTPALDSHIGKMFRRTKEGLVIFQSGYCPTNLLNFARLRVQAGTYRGTVRVRAIQSQEPVSLRIYGGDTIVNRRERHLVGYWDIPPGEWTTVTFTDQLVEDGGTYLPKCYNTKDTRKDADTYPEPGLEIGDITIEGPLEVWPPISRKKLLGDIDLSTATSADARLILQRVLPQAFRRPIRPEELAAYLELFDTAAQADRSFESALRVSLKAILCSPEFLFLDEGANSKSQILNQHALASRLSYFLWSTMPDDELMQLATAGKLNEPAVLKAQTERLLNDSKAANFVQDFSGQWLDLWEIDATEPDANLFPEFDELLRLSMLEETRLFFQEILKENLSVESFLDSEFTFLNERLAAHYGIPNVKGQEFRKVQLPKESVRGGLLTQASILKVTANGTNTSPVLRGAWVLDAILGLPSPPPPDNVGSVEPDIRGATTIREQLAKHRELESCAMCHNKIDPPGFALECFDPIGSFRTNYRSNGEGDRPEIRQAPFTNAWVRYRIGLPVDASGQTADGHEFTDIRDFKKLLYKEPDQITRSLASKLLTYGIGRRIGFADRPAVEQIVEHARTQNYGFRSLIHTVIQSKLFHQP